VLFWEYPLFTAVAKAQLTTVKVGLLKAPNSVNQLIVIKKTGAWLGMLGIDSACLDVSS